MNTRFHLTWFAAIGLLLLVCPMSQANARACAISARPQRSSNVSLPARESAPSRGSWKIVPSPNPGGNATNYLLAVANPSASSAWAVGLYSQPSLVWATLIERWDGTRWSLMPSPNPGTAGNELTGVAVVSMNDAWAVGDFANAGGPNRTLIERWDGTRWSVVPSPNVLSYDNLLDAVAVVSASDVWAVGYTRDRNSNVTWTLIEHWDGTRWRIVPSPSPGAYSNELWGIAAVSASQVWTVGYSSPSGGGNQTLIEQWNGKQWIVVASPNPTGISSLFAVAAVSASDIWAVGSFTNGLGYDRTLIEQWDGSRWSVVKSPNHINDVHNFLVGVAAISASDVWAVGYDDSGTLIERWNGTRWSIVASPNRKQCGNTLWGVAASSATDAWAVGFCHATTIEHYS